MGVQIGQNTGLNALKPEFKGEKVVLESSKKAAAKERAQSLHLVVKSSEPTEQIDELNLLELDEEEKFASNEKKKEEGPTLREIAIELDAVVDKLDKALELGDTKKIDEYKAYRDRILDHLETLY